MNLIAFYVFVILPLISLVCTCRYFLKVTISRRLSDMTKEMEIGVHTLASYPEINTRLFYSMLESCMSNAPYSILLQFYLSKHHLLYNYFSIKMEVGIEDCLHIEFEYNKSK